MWKNILIGIILVLCLGAMGLDVLLYLVSERQKAQLSAVSDKLDVESEFNSHKFRFQEDQMERLHRDLAQAEDQMRGQDKDLQEQKESLAQEAQKRQQIENDNRSVQTALVDIKAEADAIKQDMKGWQKDYVTVLAQLEKKMDDSQNDIKDLENSVTDSIASLKADIEKLPPVPVNNPAPDSSLPADNSQTSDTSFHP